jgi:hypothetical protein
MAVPTAKTIPSRNASASVAVAFAAAPTSPTAITWLPGDILIAYNSSVDTGYTVTITSNPKSRRSSTVITAEAIAFGIYRIYPRFPPQDDDTLTIEASNAAVMFARISTMTQPA